MKDTYTFFVLGSLTELGQLTSILRKSPETFQLQNIEFKHVDSRNLVFTTNVVNPNDQIQGDIPLLCSTYPELYFFRYLSWTPAGSTTNHFDVSVFQKGKILYSLFHTHTPKIKKSEVTADASL